MSGKFNGLSDQQWQQIAPSMPTQPKRVGRPSPDLRKVLNSILWVQITGSRWCDVPVGKKWGKRSTAHKWLGKLQDEGIWDKLRQEILNEAQRQSKIDWQKGAIDGSFSPLQRRRRRI